MVDSARAFPNAWGRSSHGYPHDDTALLERLQAGDDSALSALHERHVRVVHRIVGDRLGAGPDADEVTHDVFVLLWRKSRRIALAGTSCLPWLLVTADSFARDFSRTEARRSKRRASPTGHGPDAADGRRAEGWSEAQRIISTFPRADQEVFRLCTTEGLSYRRAARRVQRAARGRRGR